MAVFGIKHIGPADLRKIFGDKVGIIQLSQSIALIGFKGRTEPLQFIIPLEFFFLRIEIVK